MDQRDHGNRSVTDRDPDNMDLPPLGYALVSRPRLEALIHDVPIVIISAPAGYGKTTFAAQWARMRAAAGERVVWIDATAAQGDPVVFLREMLRQASHEQLPEPSTRGFFDPSIEMESMFDAILDQLTPSTSLLVINDLHLLEHTPAFAYVQRLVDMATMHRCVLVTSRTVPSLSLGQRAARDEVRWINVQQLAFTAEEIGTAASHFGLTLTPATRNALAFGSNGWPILVRLAFTVLRDMNLPGGTFDAVAHASHGMIRAFVREIVQALDDDSRAVLTLLAILEDGVPPLLVALADRPGQVLLEGADRLVASGLVQVRHAPGPGTLYQLPPVLRQLVVEELLISMDAASMIRHKAAQWYWSNGQLDRAIGAALVSDSGLAAEWLVSHGDMLVRQLGQLETYLHYLEKLPPELIFRHPRLPINQAWALVLLRRYAEAEKVIGCLSDIGSNEATTTQLLLTGVVAALQDDMNLAYSLLAHDKINIHDWPDFERAAAATVLMFCHKARGDFPAAHEALHTAEAAFSAVKSSYGLAWCAVAGAILLLKEGQWRSALAASRASLLDWKDRSDARSERGMLLAIEAFVHYERNDLATARAMLDESLQLLYRQGIVDAIIAGYVTAARIEAAQDNFSDALDLLAEAERIGHERHLGRLEETARAERVMMLIRGGQPDQAESLARQAGFLPLEDETTSLRYDKGVRIAARLASLGREIPELDRHLLPAIARARSTGQRYKLAELLIQWSLIAVNRENPEAASMAIQEAVSLAAEEGYVRLFVDGGEPVANVLRQFTATSSLGAGMVSGQVQEILKAFPEASREKTASAPRDLLTEALTDGELHIMQWVAQGCSNAEIAQQTFRTEGTIKWHLHNIYCKLGVSGRTAALNAMRQRSLNP